MTDVHKYTMTLTTVDIDGIAAAQQTAGAVALDLDGIESSGGTWTSPDGFAHQIAGASAANIATIIFTIVGTDANDKALTETMTGINAGAVESTGYFKTISSITPSGAVGSDVYFGIVDEAVTPTYPMSATVMEKTYAVYVSGTANVSIQNTLDNVQDTSVTPNWITLGSAYTASALVSSAVGCKGARLLVNSYSSGAVVTFYAVEESE